MSPHSRPLPISSTTLLPCHLNPSCTPYHHCYNSIYNPSHYYTLLLPITPPSHSTYPYRKHYHYHGDILLFLTPTTPSTHHYREHYNYRCYHPLPPYGYLPHPSSPPHATPHHYRPHYHYRYHLTLPPCGYHTSYYTHLPNHYRLLSPRLHPPCLPPMQCCYPLPSLGIVPGSRSRKGAF